MGFFSRLFGTENEPPRRAPGTIPPGGDAHALERYRYMLQTAPPETIEQAHREAFAQLTPAQRRQILHELAQVAPPQERDAIEATPSHDPSAVARVATRAEIRQPGVMERTLGGSPAFGFGASLLSSFAAGFVGSMVAQSFFSSLTGGYDAQDFGAEDTTASTDTEAGAEGDGWGADPDGDFGGDLDV